MTENTNERVTIIVTREQAMVMERALELYARMHIGQTEDIPYLMMDFRCKDFAQRRALANDAFELGMKIMHGENCYGRVDITEKNVEHKRAWLLYTTLRHARSWHDNPKGDHWSVCYDPPMPEIDCEYMPKCVITEVKSDENT